jgi:membrane fusion protein (multidrug efflux system)
VRRWRGFISLVRLAVLAAAGVIVVLFATQWDRWVGLSVRQVTDDAYVRGDITPLSAKVDGYVRRVPVDDFQRVKEGDLLVEIEDDDYRARVAQAEADLLGAEAAVGNLKARKAAQHAQITEAESAIAGTQADVERTRLEAARQRTLLATTFGTRQRVEQADAEAQHLAQLMSRRSPPSAPPDGGARHAGNAIARRDQIRRRTRSGQDQSWLYLYLRSGERDGQRARGA